MRSTVRPGTEVKTIQSEIAIEPNAGQDFVPEALDIKDGPERRCLVSGAVLPVTEMVRFVVGPDGMIVPDFSARLPGRGLWLQASRDKVDTAVARKLFSRAARQPVTVPPDLANLIECALVQRALNLIGLARRAGEAMFGHDKVRAWLKAGKGGILLLATDGSLSERSRMRRLAAAVPVIEVFSSAEMGAVFGREYAVHAIVAPGGLAQRLIVECGRLGGFRTGVSNVETGSRASDILERDCDE